MPDTELTVSQPIVVTVALEGLDFNDVVAAIGQALARAGGELLGRLVRAVERQAQGRQPRRWVNRGQVTRRLRLPWGEVAVRRTRVRDQATGCTYNLADRLLGWRPYARRGVAEVQTACELAVTLPYRAARHWWQRLTGMRISVMSFWRMVQRAGQRLVAQERDEVGEIRPGDPPPRAVRRVYLEADGAWLRRQKARRTREPGAPWPARGAGPAVDVGQAGEPAPDQPAGSLLLYVGASYSQLHQTGRRRWNAVDKQVLAEVENLRSFGRQWAWQVSRRFDLTRTPNQLFLSDGEDGLLRLARRQFRSALVQLDRFHVHQQLGRAFGLRTPGYRAALRALCQGRLGEVHSLLALRGVGSRRAICQEVRTYLDRHAAILWTHAEWERRTTVRKLGSGVIEKTIETQINRRMKWKGMSWSPPGARRLAKLRVLYPDGPRWAAFWARRLCETKPPAGSTSEGSVS
jgi:hypothetical protein